MTKDSRGKKICKALIAREEASRDQSYLRLLVALTMPAFRVALELWLENDAQGDLVALLREHLQRLSPLEQTDKAAN